MMLPIKLYRPDSKLVAYETRPKTGRISTYTSGCPKNQNRCSNRIQSPPFLTSKKVVFMLRSNSSIVIPAANTGRLIINRIESS